MKNMVWAGGGGGGVVEWGGWGALRDAPGKCTQTYEWKCRADFFRPGGSEKEADQRFCFDPSGPARTPSNRPSRSCRRLRRNLSSSPPRQTSSHFKTGPQLFCFCSHSRRSAQIDSEGAAEPLVLSGLAMIFFFSPKVLHYVLGFFLSCIDDRNFPPFENKHWNNFLSMSVIVHTNELSVSEKQGLGFSLCCEGFFKKVKALIRYDYSKAELEHYVLCFLNLLLLIIVIFVVHIYLVICCKENLWRNFYLRCPIWKVDWSDWVKQLLNIFNLFFIFLVFGRLGRRERSVDSHFEVSLVLLKRDWLIRSLRSDVSFETRKLAKQTQSHLLYANGTSPVRRLCRGQCPAPLNVFVGCVFVFWKEFKNTQHDWYKSGPVALLCLDVLGFVKVSTPVNHEPAKIQILPCMVFNISI